jgi:hypothetical protein
MCSFGHGTIKINDGGFVRLNSFESSREFIQSGVYRKSAWSVGLARHSNLKTYFFFGAAFFVAGLVGAAFLGAAFLATGFTGVAFLAAGFFGAADFAVEADFFGAAALLVVAFLAAGFLTVTFAVASALADADFAAGALAEAVAACLASPASRRARASRRFFCSLGSGTGTAANRVLV